MADDVYSLVSSDHHQKSGALVNRVGAKRLVSRVIGWLLNLPRDTWGILFLVSMAFPIYWDRLREGRHLSRVDIVTQFLPNYTYLGERLRAGELPGWNPYTSSGMPFLGDPQSGWAYLPAMTLFSLLEPFTAVQAHVIFHVLLAGLGTYGLARVSGLNYWGATVAGLAMQYGGIVVQLRSVWVQAQLTAWLPIAFLAVELSVSAVSFRRRAIGWSIGALAVSQLIAGWTGQGSAYGLFAIGFYGFLRAATISLGGRKISVAGLVRHAVDCAAIALFGLGLSAAGLWIRLFVNEDALIAEGSYDRAVGAAQLPNYRYTREIVSALLYPSANVYIGGAALGLALISILVAKNQRWRAVLYVLYGVLIVDLVHAHGFLRNSWYLVPKFQDLHEHDVYRALALMGLPIAMLAGIAVDALARSKRSWRILLLLAFVPWTSAIILEDLLWTQRPRLQPEARTGLIAISALIAGTAGLFLFKPHLKGMKFNLLQGALFVGILVTLALDPIGLQFNRELPRRAQVMPTNEVFSEHLSRSDSNGPGEFLQQQKLIEGPFRFLGYGSSILASGGARSEHTYHGRFRDPLVLDLLFNRAIRLGLYSIQGYNPSQLRRYAEFLQAVNGQPINYHDAKVLPEGLDSPLLRMLNLRYVIVERTNSADLPEIDQLLSTYPTVYSNDLVTIVEVTDSMPAAWIVHDAVEASREEAFELIKEPDFDPNSLAVIEGVLPTLESPQSASDEQVIVTNYAPDRITLTASLGAPGLIVISEIYARGWQAFVDGKRTPILPTNYILRGIAVPAGTHSIELKYAPPAIWRGIAVSLLTAAILAILIVQPWRFVSASARRQKGHQVSSPDSLKSCLR